MCDTCIKKELEYFKKKILSKERVQSIIIIRKVKLIVDFFLNQIKKGVRCKGRSVLALSDKRLGC
jgi:hypothetical protein